MTGAGRGRLPSRSRRVEFPADPASVRGVALADETDFDAPIFRIVGVVGRKGSVAAVTHDIEPLRASSQPVRFWRDNR